jgi:hypothetical protein
MNIEHIKKKFKAAINSRAASMFLIVCIFGMASAAAHNGFYTKWKLHEGFDWSAERVLDGTAIRPFIYRQLAPSIANTINEKLPNIIKERFLNHMGSVKEHGIPYSIIYSMNYIFLFLSLFALRRVLLDQGINGKSVIFVPIVFMLFTPYLQTVGGYYYDSIEIFFFATAVSMALRGNYLGLLILSAIATFNKESFLFFIPCLYPLMPKNWLLKMKVFCLMGMFFISLLINLYIKIKYQDNAGGFVQFHALDDFIVYLDPSIYFLREITYGVVSPSGLNVITVLFIGLIIIRGWHSFSESMKYHAIIAMVINIPLFILFCAIGELRNLSMLYPSFVVALAYCLSDQTCEFKISIKS